MEKGKSTYNGLLRYEVVGDGGANKLTEQEQNIPRSRQDNLLRVQKGVFSGPARKGQRGRHPLLHFPPNQRGHQQ